MFGLLGSKGGSGRIGWHGTLFVVMAGLSALFTMATALSVGDFLMLIFPTAKEGTGLSLGMGSLIGGWLDSLYLWLASGGILRALVLYALLLLVVYGLKNVCSYLAAVFYAMVKAEVSCGLRAGLHAAVLRQRFANWSQQQQGQWLSLMGNDLSEYEANMMDGMKLFIQSLLSMIIYVAMLVYLDWKLTLLVVVVMAVGTFVLSASRKLKRRSRLLQGLGGELMATTQETLDSLKEIKAATAIDYVNGLHGALNENFTKRRISIYRSIYAASPLSDFLGNVIVVAILVMGALRVLGDDASLSPAFFVSYVIIYVLMLTPIKEFSNSIALIKKGRGVEQRLAEVILDRENRGDICEGEDSGNGATWGLEIKDVCFAYGDNRVFDGLNIVFSIHKSTAIVGESGAGKSTLGRILVGLIDPDSGEVLINGRPTTAKERAGRIAYVPQEPMLFNDTLAGNIRCGREWITDDDIKEAVRVAQLDNLVDTLPEGLETNIGDGGGRLSGGERQRVNIARALAGKAEVIVLDEATAALDAATEMRFTECVADYLKGCTLIVIAHRASTIAHCDEVVRL